MLIIVIIC